MEKKCFKCGTMQPIGNFYKHAQMLDGHVNKCKSCNKKDVQANYRTNKTQYQDYERRREQEPNRKAAKKRYLTKYRKENPEKNRARARLDYAIKNRTVAPLPCEVCGDKKSEGHHDDYSKPLEVRWLCFKHHREFHGQTIG